MMAVWAGRWRVWVGAAILAVAGVAWAQDEPASQPVRINRGPTPEYPVPYATPSVENITASLRKIRQRLDRAIVSRVVVAQTGEDYVALDQPRAGVTLDPGEDGKFRPIIYPVGVIHSGMLAAYEATGDKTFADFSTTRFQFYLDTMAKLQDWPVRQNPFRPLVSPNSLDACGAMGTAMIKAQRAGLGPDMKTLVIKYADYVLSGQIRLEDGTIARNTPVAESVWADDMYMCVPILAQAGKLTGETKYFDEAAKQVTQISDKLFLESDGLFTHGWNTQNPDYHPRYFWGRANGWCIMAMAELLDVMPEDHPQRAAMLKIFSAHAQGLATRQSGSGLWRQLINREDSYLETSGTAMITFAILRGVNRGWLDAFTFGPIGQAGWNGLSTRIGDDGHIDGTCIGTNYANDYVYYYNRPVDDDIHGYGPTLLAGAEMLQLLKNPDVRIERGRSGPATYRRR